MVKTKGHNVTWVTKLLLEMPTTPTQALPIMCVRAAKCLIIRPEVPWRITRLHRFEARSESDSQIQWNILTYREFLRGIHCFHRPFQTRPDTLLGLRRETDTPQETEDTEKRPSLPAAHALLPMIGGNGSGSFLCGSRRTCKISCSLLGGNSTGGLFLFPLTKRIHIIPPFVH